MGKNESRPNSQKKSIRQYENDFEFNNSDLGRNMPNAKKNALNSNGKNMNLSGKADKTDSDSGNRNKISVALQYNPGEEAPKIIASGRGVIADKIIEKAKESEIPVYEDSKLANTLSKLEIGDMIPPELYNVVAEILVFVDDCDRLRGKMK